MLMEKRIGATIVVIHEKASIPELNAILSVHADTIIGRQGIPFRDRPFSIISLVLEGTTDTISSLTGKIGRLKGVQIKSVLTKNQGDK